MAQDFTMGTQHAGQGQVALDYLRQEIAFFESRLDEMGEKGDCAYEHALSKAYQILLRERKRQLAELKALS